MFTLLFVCFSLTVMSAYNNTAYSNILDIAVKRPVTVMLCMESENINYLQKCRHAIFLDIVILFECQNMETSEKRLSQFSSDTTESSFS